MATASYQRCQNHPGWPFGFVKGIDFYFEGLEVLMRSPVNHKTLCFNLLQTFTGPIPRAWI